MLSKSMIIPCVLGLGLTFSITTGCAKNQSNKEATVLPPPPAMTSEPMPASMATADTGQEEATPATSSPTNQSASHIESDAMMPPPAPSSTSQQNTTTYPVGKANQTYTVQRGDTLWSIAKRVYGDGKLWEKIAQINGLSNPKQLKVGQKLILP